MRKSVGLAVFFSLAVLVAAVYKHPAEKSAFVLSAADRLALRDAANSGDLNGELPAIVDKDRLAKIQAAAVGQGAAPGASAGCNERAYGPDPDPRAPLPTLDVKSRISGRGREYPSVFQAWAPAQGLDLAPFGGVTALPAGDSNIALHDLTFVDPGALGLLRNNGCEGLATGFIPGSVATGLAHRKNILSTNPHAVLLAAILYMEAPPNYLPASSSFWVRDDNSQPKPSGYTNNLLLNYSDPDFQKQVAGLCRAAVQSGVFDGCMFDNWRTDDAGRIGLVTKVRTAIGNDALILVNVGGHRLGATAPYINGVFIEGLGSSWNSDWKAVMGNIQWFNQNLKAPAFAALEGVDSNSRSDPADLQKMRALTALALTQSGYVLFDDPNHNPSPSDPSSGKLHDWYPFWDKGLGTPSGEAVNQQDGSLSREFTGGTVVFNPPWNDRFVTVKFSDGDRTSRATHKRGARHEIQPGDGDIFIK